jgi:hypothetical protein
MAESLYKRVFEQEPGLGLLQEFMESVRDNITVQESELMISKGTPLDLVAIWHFMDNNTNGIARLSIRIFSIIANSGATECNFSNFGNIQTKKHSHLSVTRST